MTDEKKTPAFFPSLPAGRASIRRRLLRGSLAIVFLAIAIMGAFVFISTGRTHATLIARLDVTTRSEAENLLAITADRQAETLSNFFNNLQANILSLQKYDQNLLLNRQTFGSGAYWDAAASLARNDKGSWDNPNTESGSVFIPAAAELTESMVAELNAIRHMDLLAPSILQANPDIIAVYFGGSSGYTLYYPNIDLAAIVPPDFNVTSRPWYTVAGPEANPSRGAVWSDPYLDAALNGIIITNSAPVYDSADRLAGVVAQDIQLTKISQLVGNIHVGESGYAFLIDRQGRLIAMPEAGYTDLKITPDLLPLGGKLTATNLGATVATLQTVLSEMTAGDSGLTEINLNGVNRFVIYRPVRGVEFSLAIIVPVDEMLAKALEARRQLERENLNALGVSIFVVLGIFGLTLLVTRNFSNNLIAPLLALTRTAEEMAKGNLEARASVAEQDEIGTLATTLNSMAAELKASIDSLEMRVAERTKEVEQRGQELQTANAHLQRRAAQFEAMAQVAQSIASIRDLKELLPRIASVISEKYGFYHVGVFLLDENNEYAVLTAANSEGGQRMLARQHRLKVGEQGIVGSVTASGQPRIALDVGADAVFFNNPDLPDTHSEMALPLFSGGKVIGALDVQSTEAGAFTEEDIQTLSLLAEQVSLAIENARLFEASNRTLNELQTLMRQSTREAWKRLPHSQKLLGYRYNAMGSSPLTEPIQLTALSEKKKTEAAETASIVVPIELRGEVIGRLVVQSPSASQWGTDEKDLIQAVAERVALSAENARLFEETTRRAERERLVSEITGKIRSHNDPQAMIETALQELRQALGATRVEILPKASDGKDK
ncbi:MAG: GAF domain-containing protein [Chloroflexota bacterium]|nr:GAF domain-containing protein [Chloroflexota bacterium]MBI5704222.1 GAF domain-containing protein [Chloroflexota bacterium]